MDENYTKKIKWQEETQMDRLSDLPDSLIHHILSFMDAKYAVQTCILSKRWVSVWTHLPVLKLDSKLFNREGSFRNFISQLLDHYEMSNILTLSICLHKKNLPWSLVDKIISFAVSHGVQELDLSLNGRPIGDLQNVFRCQSLRILKLDSLWKVPSPNSISLASLKTLILCKVRLKSENHCFDLFSSCLDLQNLVLDRVSLTISDIFNISAPALVNLTICNISLYVVKDGKIMWSIKDRKIVITAPRLTSFGFTWYRVYRPVSLSMDNSPLLENVNLSMFPDNLPYIQEVYFMFLIDMLRQLGNARSLTISLGIVKCLSQHPSLLEEQPCPFSKLESLKVVSGRQSREKIPPNVLNFLVQGSPMAEELLDKFQKILHADFFPDFSCRLLPRFFMPALLMARRRRGCQCQCGRQKFKRARRLLSPPPSSTTSCLTSATRETVSFHDPISRE